MASSTAFRVAVAEHDSTSEQSWPGCAGLAHSVHVSLPQPPSRARQRKMFPPSSAAVQPQWGHDTNPSMDAWWVVERGISVKY